MTTIDRPDWQRRLQDKISYTESPESKRMRLRTLELANQAAVPAEKLMADEIPRLETEIKQRESELAEAKQTSEEVRAVAHLFAEFLRFILSLDRATS